MIKVTVSQVKFTVDAAEHAMRFGADPSMFDPHAPHGGVAMSAAAQAYIVAGVDTETGEGLDMVVSNTGRTELWAEGRATYDARLMRRVAKRLRYVLRCIAADAKGARKDGDNAEAA